MKIKRFHEKGEVSLLSCFQQQVNRDNSYTAANYRSTMRLVSRFLGNKAAKFTLENITTDWLWRYIRYMQEANKLSASSSDLHLRTLRSVYNTAVRLQMTSRKESSPFDGVSITVPDTMKRALSGEDFLRIRDMDLSKSPEKERVRDLFVLMLYCRGMCFIDAFNLTWDNIYDGYINYTRSKTEAPIHVLIEPEIADLLKHFKGNKDNYVFSFLHYDRYDTEKELGECSALHRVNRLLKEIGEELGLPFPLTTYVARHTWASLAEECGIATGIISQGMGHSSEHTTRIYMRGMPSRVINEANQLIFDRIIRPKGKGGKDILKKNKKRCPILPKNETSG